MQTTPHIAAILSPDDPRWLAALGRVKHDIYHLPGYVASASEWERDTQPAAFYAELSGEVCLIPLLIKKLPIQLQLPDFWCDFASPYGYPAPVFSCPDDTELIASFVELFRQESDKAGACSVFLRMHPLLESRLPLHSPMSRIVTHGETVICDLMLQEEETLHETRSGHLYDIKRLEKMKFAISIDDWSQYDEFIRIYRETMIRVEADQYYLFDSKYFASLRASLGDSLHLCCALSPDGKIVAGGLFTEVGDIIQYYLGGSCQEYRKYGAMKYVIHFMRLWGNRKGCAVLHLGGGAGARSDSLFQFKAGFSPLRRKFQTYRMIPNESRYASLCQSVGRIADLEADLTSTFFPPHRDGSAASLDLGS